MAKTLIGSNNAVETETIHLLRRFCFNYRFAAHRPGSLSNRACRITSLFADATYTHYMEVEKRYCLDTYLAIRNRFVNVVTFRQQE